MALGPGDRHLHTGTICHITDEIGHAVLARASDARIELVIVIVAHDEMALRQYRNRFCGQSTNPDEPKSLTD
jgi:hypothetical protein